MVRFPNTRLTVYTRGTPTLDSEGGVSGINLVEGPTIRADVQPIGSSPITNETWGISTLKEGARTAVIDVNPAVQPTCVVVDTTTLIEYDVTAVKPWPHHYMLLLDPTENLV